MRITYTHYAFLGVLLTTLCFSVTAQNRAGELTISLRFPEKNPIYLPQNEARTYMDDGWVLVKNGQEIPDPSRSPVQVTVNIPPELQAGKVGTYTVTYKARDPVDLLESVQQTRTVIVTNINECQLPIGDPDHHKCSPNANCTDTNGSYLCTCKDGYEDKSPADRPGTKCVDIDECQIGSHDCHVDAECINLSPFWTCACKPGFEGDGKKIGSGCVNINECIRAPPFCHNCISNAICIDKSPGFTCECKPGFRGDGVIRCTPLNPCDDGRHNCPADAVCQPLLDPPYYRCDCGLGYHFNEKTGLCQDIDECANPTLNRCDPQTSRCVNLEAPAFYRCDCIDGYEHPPREKIRCANINECLKETHMCDINAQCIDLDPLKDGRKYDCRCNAPTWVGDGFTCKKAGGDRIFELNRGNLTIQLCTNYIEYGYLLDEDKGKGITVRSNVPRELEQQYVTTRGVFLINYTAEDQSGQIKEHAAREVTVTGYVDHCNFPVGHPCRHKCAPMTTCEQSDNPTGYVCRCPATPFQTVPPNTDCPDVSPPVITLQPSGSEYIVYAECRVCNHTFKDSKKYKMADHGHWVEAHDIDALGVRHNITHKITTREISKGDRKNAQDYFVQYSVSDDAGNAAPTVTREIHYDIQDVQAAIGQIQEDMHRKEAERERNQELPYRVAGFVGKVLLFLPYLIGLIIALYVLPRILNMLSVWYLVSTGQRVKYRAWEQAYDQWFALVHPTWSAEERQREAHVQYQRRYHDE